MSSSSSRYERHSRDRYDSRSSDSRHSSDNRHHQRRDFSSRGHYNNNNRYNNRDDHRDNNRRNYQDNNKFRRNDQVDSRRTSSGYQRYQGNRGGYNNYNRGRFDNRRGNFNSHNNRFNDDRRGQQRYDNRNQSGYRRGNFQTNRFQQRNDSDRMPPPNRRFISNRGDYQQRRTSSTAIRRTTDDRTVEVRRRLAEKHAIRNPTNDLLAKKIRMAKMRSTLTARRKITALPTRRLKSAVGKKPEKKEKSKDDDASSSDSDDSDSDKEKEIKEEDKASNKSDDSDDSTDEKESSGEKVKVKKEKETPKKEKPKVVKEKIKVRLNLECIHCKSKCATVSEYRYHLMGLAHNRAMRNLAARQRAQLSDLRRVQRATQKEIDEKLGDVHSNNCKLCQLHYKQSRSEHVESEDHNAIQKLLRPYCGVCKMSFTSMMTYEHHRCDLNHLKRKAVAEKTGQIDDPECEVDLEKFTTVDEIGDEEDEEMPEEDAEEERINPDDAEVEIENEEEINVGSDHIKQVQAHYCELCYSYISHRGDVDLNLKRHCATQQHLKFYIRFKDELMLKEEAEAIHKKRQAEKKKKEKEAAEKKAKADAEKAEKKESEAKEEEKADDLNGSNKVEDSEIWDTLNQDIGELIEDDDESTQDKDEKNKDAEKEVKENGTNGVEKSEASEKPKRKSLQRTTPAKAEAKA